MDEQAVGWVERIVRLEETVKTMTKSIDTQEASQTEIKEKLDELLELKSKGMGAVWLISAILGTGVLAFVGVFFRWVKGG